MANKHVAPEAPETLQDRFRDAIAPRTLALGLGVLLLQLGFILSYLGAFHSPTPHRIPVEVVAPAQAAGQLVDKLNDPAEAIEFDFPEVAEEIWEAGWRATRRAMEILYDTRWDEASRRFIPPLPIEEELQDD